MLVVWLGKLPHAKPLHIQRQHAALHLVNAERLLIAGDFADRVMAVDGEQHGHLGRGHVRLIEQRGNPEAGHGFVAEFADVVAGAAGDGFEPLNLRGRRVPAGGLTAQDDALQDVLAQAIGVAGPVFGRGERRHLRHPRLDVVLDFAQH